jgi:ATP-dependent exoDNAse (exonuclease V) beta subunit
MKTNITFVSASAGSGKTHHISEVVEEHLSEGSCRPAGLIATTYTVKAAQELRERVRRRLYDSGHSKLAERMQECLMGTVHSVCGQLLQRFAFEAGISPRLEILAEDEAESLLGQAVGMAVDFQTLKQLQELADVLGQKDSQTSQYYWQRQVRAVIDAARANDFPPDSLEAMGQQSAEELVAFLPGAAAGNLDGQLAAALQHAIERISQNGDETKTTTDYVDLLGEARQALRAGRMPWSVWVKLSKAQPGKKSQVDAAPVVRLASQVASHARLRENIRDYITMVFRAARLSLAEFQSLKEERGLVDFSDLEQRALHLLRDRPHVCETLAGELDLLVVDEFQDTSPIQLALFMHLSTCAHETVWVGDVKQAIYGFRSSDPDLIKTVVEQVGKGGRLAEPLAKSWRSTPELVSLTNALFAPAFGKSLGLPAAEIQLQPQRPSIAPPQPAVVFMELSSGQFNKTNGKLRRLTNVNYAAALGEGVVRLLSQDDRCRVEDRETRELRPVELRDVAILCRTNDAAARVAEALTQRGLAVALSQSGLLATPEARLALACLRRLADSSDTLASAEIVALESTRLPEEWLEDRLEYVARRLQQAQSAGGDRWGLEEPFVHPGLVALDQARARLNVLSPSEALDVAISSANVFAVVSAWGPTKTRASQRRGNLESLRALVAQYEQDCVKSPAPATIAGFLFSCDDLVASGADSKAADEQVNAVHVSTYHKAKGLEWPVVICTGLDSEPRPRLWEVTVGPVDSTKPFDLAKPLSNRHLRFWPWPFGSQESGVPLAANVEAGAVGQKARRAAEEEELRLLYVALTRARDRLVLVLEKEQPAPWLESLQAAWLRPGGGKITLPDTNSIGSSTMSLTPPAAAASTPIDSTYTWFPASLSPAPKEPGRLTPSSQAEIPGSSIGRIIDLGSRLPFSGSPDETDLGNALHAVLATDFLNPGHRHRLEAVQRILHGHKLENCLKSEDVMLMADRLRGALERHFQPKRVLVEVPIEATNALGQRIEGFIDLLLETEHGWVVVEHKSFPGKRVDWAGKALSYSGQLALYREALTRVNMPAASVWLHFAVGGGLVEVLPHGSP